MKTMHTQGRRSIQTVERWSLRQC